MKKNLTTPTTTVDNRKIVDYTDSASLGVVLFKQDDIQAITKNTGPLVNANEYQVHYHFLNGRATFSDNSYIDIAIPTCYFNYKQEVSSSAVDFHLNDVDTMSEMLAPVANTKMNELLASNIATHIATMFTGVTFEWKGVNLGTIHKHPGSLDSFSGTDLSTKIADPGICFPLGVIEENYFKPSFSSIILHKAGRPVIGHTEYRLAQQVDETVSYYKGRCLTLVAGSTSQPSEVEKLLGVEPVDASYTETDNVTKIPAILTALHEHLKLLDYSASTDFVKAANVSVKSYTKNYNNNKTTTSKTTDTIPHTSSPKYKEVAKYLLENDQIPLYEWKDIASMPLTATLEHLNTLEQFVSVEPITHLAYTGKTNQQIMSLQNTAWREAKTDMDLEAIRQANAHTYHLATVAEMEKDLRIWGVSEEMLKSYTVDELEHVYELFEDAEYYA